MAQNTNLNISPYFDDFDDDKGFLKVLFKPEAFQYRQENLLPSSHFYKTKLIHLVKVSIRKVVWWYLAVSR